MSDDVLRYIPGEIIAAAGNTLPPAQTCQEEFREVVAEVPVRGFTARIRFKRFRHKRGKNVRYFWTVDSAVKI